MYSKIICFHVFFSQAIATLVMASVGSPMTDQRIFSGHSEQAQLQLQTLDQNLITRYCLQKVCYFTGHFNNNNSNNNNNNNDNVNNGDDDDSDSNVNKNNHENDDGSKSDNDQEDGDNNNNNINNNKNINNTNNNNNTNNDK